ncbi:MAG: hypothetical protein WD404_09540 [Solirubrobacterales bacterium]
MLGPSTIEREVASVPAMRVEMQPRMPMKKFDLVLRRAYGGA